MKTLFDYIPEIILIVWNDQINLKQVYNKIQITTRLQRLTHNSIEFTKFLNYKNEKAILYTLKGDFP